MIQLEKNYSKKYSFKKLDNYSFKEIILFFFEKLVIAQGYFQIFGKGEEELKIYFHIFEFHITSVSFFSKSVEKNGRGVFLETSWSWFKSIFEEKTSNQYLKNKILINILRNKYKSIFEGTIPNQYLEKHDKINI